MSYGFKRFVSGQAVEIQRRRRDGNMVNVTWETGGNFSHFDRDGNAVVTTSDGHTETIRDPTTLR